MTIIDVRNLTKRFGARTAVDNVALKIEQGEIVGFLGPNGSGKTTTIRMLCGLLKPDAGEGHVLGFDIVRGTAQIKRRVGYMTQRFSLYEDLTIEENLFFVARIYDMPRPHVEVSRTLDSLGLTARRKQLAATLSGGWKQRLALAACVMHRPDLLLLDEPTAGVDPIARRQFWDSIHGLSADGLTVLVSTHHMDEAERCQRISFIAGGKIIAVGTADEVAARSGLITYVVRGPQLAALKAEIEKCEGVDQVAPFGSSLHVVGVCRESLEAALAPYRSGSHDIAQAPTSIEDVFIRFINSKGEQVA